MLPNRRQKNALAAKGEIVQEEQRGGGKEAGGRGAGMKEVKLREAWERSQTQKNKKRKKEGVNKRLKYIKVISNSRCASDSALAFSLYKNKKPCEMLGSNTAVDNAGGQF